MKKEELNITPSKHEKIEIISYETLILDRDTGQLVEEIPAGSRPGRYRIMQDFSKVPSQTDQSQRDENNINVLVKKYKPDELAAYLAAKNSHKQEIVGHDFSQEPELMQAMNVEYRIRQEFESLPEDLQNLFKGKPSKFLEFCENPKNRDQVEAWGLAKKTPETIEALNAIKRNEAEQKKSDLLKLKAQLAELDSNKD